MRPTANKVYDSSHSKVPDDVHELAAYFVRDYTNVKRITTFSPFTNMSRGSKYIYCTYCVRKISNERRVYDACTRMKGMRMKKNNFHL